MIRLDDLALFVRAAALGSFSNAAREVNILPAQVSAAIKRLEGELNIRLFARSTRSLRLTPEGELYLPYASNVLQTLRAGQDLLHQTPAGLLGQLQIAAPSDLGRNVLLPCLAAFRREHPRLNVRLCIADRITDVFKEPVDVAFRYGIMHDASFIALPLSPLNRRVLVASPAYLQRFSRPATLEALADHNCLRFVLRGRIYDKWAFYRQGEKQVVQVSGTLTSDDAEVVHRLALAGEGIAYKSWLDVGQDVIDGRLEILLGEYQGEPSPLNLICPHRQQFSPAARQLYERVRVWCEALQREYEVLTGSPTASTAARAQAPDWQ